MQKWPVRFDANRTERPSGRELGLALVGRRRREPALLGRAEIESQRSH